MELYDLNDTINLNKLILHTPKQVQGGGYYSNIKIGDNKLFLQTPKIKTRNGIKITGKKMYLDMLFSKDNLEFIEIINNIQEKIKELIIKKGKLWFNSEPSLTDINDRWIDSFKVYKSDKALIRTRIINKSNKPDIVIWNEQQEVIEVSEFNIEDDSILIFSIDGLKFSSTTFQLDLVLKQLMTFKKPNLKKCLFKGLSLNESKKDLVKTEKDDEKTIKKQEQQVEKERDEEGDEDEHEDEEGDEHDEVDEVDEDSEEEGDEEDESDLDSEMDSDEESEMDSDEESEMDSDEDSEMDSDEESDEETQQTHQQETEKEIVSNQSVLGDSEKNTNVNDTTDNNVVDVVDKNLKHLEKEEESNEIEKTKKETENKGIENKGIENKIQENNNKILNNKESLVKETNNSLEEINLEVNEKSEILKLKKPKEVYIEIYKKALQKAKQIKKQAMMEYLNAKKIKNTYLLDDLEISDDEDLETFSE